MRTPHLNASWPQMHHNTPEHHVYCSRFSPFSSLTSRSLLPRGVKTSLPGGKTPQNPRLSLSRPGTENGQSRCLSPKQLMLDSLGWNSDIWQLKKVFLRLRRTDTVSPVPDRHQLAGCPSLTSHPAFRGTKRKIPEKDILQDSGPHYHRVPAGLVRAIQGDRHICIFQK
jgi:hypothetical protein